MTSPATQTASLLLEQFVTEARNAAATAEVVDRNPQALSSAILAKAGDAERILFAPPQVMSPELFAPFAADSRVLTEPDSEQMVHSAAGVTEAFAGVASTGSVCIDVSYERTGMVSLLAPLQIAVVAAETIVPQTARPVSRRRAGRQRADARLRLRHRPQRHRRHGAAGARRSRAAQAAHHCGEVSHGHARESRRHPAAAGSEQEQTRRPCSTPSA